MGLCERLQQGNSMSRTQEPGSLWGEARQARAQSCACAVFAGELTDGVTDKAATTPLFS